MVFSISGEDAGAATAGSVIVFEGERLIVCEVVRDGLSSRRLVC